MMSWQDVLDLPRPRPDHHISYGEDPQQFGQLRLPGGKGPHPVVIVIHGGCWRAQYDLHHVSGLCAALTDAGAATWSLEYRRLRQEGGGWPGTFLDVARGADKLRELAARHRLDSSRVIATGHSAGGHLALWLAARSRLPKNSRLYVDDPLPLGGVVSLAGIADLGRAVASRTCGNSAARLLGGPPTQHPERYRQGSPIELLPFGVSQRLISGSTDDVVPLELVRRYAEEGKRAGDDVELQVIDDAGHFDLIAPGSAAWPIVQSAVVTLLGGERKRK